MPVRFFSVVADANKRLCASRRRRSVYIPARRVAALTFVLALLIQSAASAATRTPTATPVPPRVVFGGQAWVNAKLSSDPITAKIGDTLCGTAIFIAVPEGSPVYSLEVPSQESVPGCGHEGATITFFVGERQAPQTAVWHAGESQRLNLIIGAPFAEFFVSGTAAESITPYINGKACGYGGIVYSAEQEPGCGVEGSQVTFKRMGGLGKTTFETGIWHAWDGISDPLPVTRISGSPGGIGLPPTGSALPNDGGLEELLASLGLVGLAGTVVGLALRKVVATR